MTQYIYFLKTAISILVILNHNSFRVLFDASVAYILFEKNIYKYWKWPTQGTCTVPIVSAHFSSPFYRRRYTVKLSVLHENCTHADERHQSLSLELVCVRETMRDSSEVNSAREQLALSRYWPFTRL